MSANVKLEQHVEKPSIRSYDTADGSSDKASRHDLRCGPSVPAEGQQKCSHEGAPLHGEETMSSARLLLAVAVFWALSLMPPIRGALPQERGSNPAMGTGRPVVELYGDSLPRGAISRLGSIRYHSQDSIQTMGLLPRELVVLTPDRGLRYYDPLNGKLLRAVPVKLPYVNLAAMSGNRKWLALTGFRFDQKRAAVIHYLAILDAETGASMLSVERAEDIGASVAISDDGRTAATVNEKGQLRLWDVSTGTDVVKYRLDRRVTYGALSFSPNSAVLAVGAENVVALWRWRDEERPRNVQFGDERSRSDVACVAFTPDGSSLAVGFDKRNGVTLLDVASGAISAEILADKTAGDPVRHIAFSPDGRRLAVAMWNDRRGGSVILWDFHDKKMLRTLETNQSGAGQLGFSVDGRFLAAVTDFSNNLKLWDVETGKPVPGELENHTEYPNSIRFLDGDRRVATASDDGTIRIWDSKVGKLSKVLSHVDRNALGERAWVRGLAVSPDGRFVASSSIDDTVRLWDAATGKEIYRLPGHGRTGGRRSLAFTKFGKQLVSWGDGMRVYIWDVATGKAINEYVLRPSGVKVPGPDDPSTRGHLEATGHFSPDGTRLVLDCGSRYIFDVETGKELGKLRPEPWHVIYLAISPDNRFVLTSGLGPPTETPMANGGGVFHSNEKNHIIALRRLDTGETVKEIALPEGGAGPVAFSADGSRFAIGVGEVYVGTAEMNPSIRIFETSSGSELGQIDGLGSAPRCLEFSRDGKLIATGLHNCTAIIWDLSQAVRPSSKVR